MRIDLLRDNIVPSEGEVSVRAYYCTQYRSRLLGLETGGYLAVTNKRVIYQAVGNTSAGKSIIQSEVPVADVSGITSYKGTYFSILHFLSGIVLSAVTSALALGLLAGLFFSDFDMSDIRVASWILGLLFFGLSFFVTKGSLLKGLLVSTGASLVGSIAQLSFLDPLSFLFGRVDASEIVLPSLLAAVFGIYALVCFFWYARRPTISLAIGSKGGSNTPIAISGTTGIGLFDIAAGKALSAHPARDAEPMLAEVGAVIMDIQTLGDLGIKKWSGR